MVECVVSKNVPLLHYSIKLNVSDCHYDNDDDTMAITMVSHFVGTAVLYVKAQGVKCI